MPTRKKSRNKTTPQKRRSKKRVLKKKPTSKKLSRRKASIRLESSAPRIIPGPARRTSEVNSGMLSLGRRGLGPAAAGQSGDIQGLPRGEDADTESVEELVEEGQALEAEFVSGVENAPDADQGEIR